MQDFKTGGYCPSCLHSKNECTCLQQQLNRITSASNDAKPRVSGSLLLLELMQVAAIKNEDGMPVVNYVDKPNGGSIAYLRHDAVVKRLNSMLEYQFPTIDEAGVIAVQILENVTPELTAQEQAFFVAGFKECLKWLGVSCNDR